MPLSYVLITASTGQTDFTFTFPYQLTSEVQVYKAGVLQVLNTHYTFPSTNTVRFVTAMTGGELVRIGRNTSSSPKTSFATVASGGDALDVAYLQTLYRTEEVQDDIDDLSSFNSALGTYDFKGNRLTNVGTPTGTTDAATKGYVDTLVGAGSITDASALLVQTTGSDTPRTLANRFVRVFNVKDYGAIGDGVTDDTTNIQQAIDAALAAAVSGPTIGAVVYFERGLYKVSATLTYHPTSTPPSGGPYAVLFLGDGQRVSVLKSTAPGATILLDGTTFGSIGYFKGFTLEGDSSTTTIGLHLKNTQWYQNKISEVEVRGFTTNHVRIENCWNGTFEDSHVGGDSLSSPGAVYGTNANGWTLGNVFVRKTCWGDNAFAFRFEDSPMVNMTGCQCDEIGGAIYFKNCASGPIIRSFWVEKCHNPTPGGGTGEAVGLKFENVDHAVIEGGQIIWDVDSALGTTITGWGIAVKFIDSKNCRISSQRIFGGGTYTLGTVGVDVDANCRNIIVTQDNRFGDNYAWAALTTGVNWPKIREAGVLGFYLTGLDRVVVPHDVIRFSVNDFNDAQINVDGGYVPVKTKLPDPGGGESVTWAWSLPDHAAGDQVGLSASGPVLAERYGMCCQTVTRYCTTSTAGGTIRLSTRPTIVGEGTDVRGWNSASEGTAESASDYALKMLVAPNSLVLVPDNSKHLNLVVSRNKSASDTSTKACYILGAEVHFFRADWSTA